MVNCCRGWYNPQSRTREGGSKGEFQWVIRHRCKNHDFQSQCWAPAKDTTRAIQVWFPRKALNVNISTLSRNQSAVCNPFLTCTNFLQVKGSALAYDLIHCWGPILVFTSSLLYHRIKFGRWNKVYLELAQQFSNKFLNCLLKLACRGRGPPRGRGRGGDYVNRGGPGRRAYNPNRGGRNGRGGRDYVPQQAYQAAAY